MNRQQTLGTAGLALWLGAGLAAGDAQAAPTDGMTPYTATYKVQNRTAAPLAQRFTIADGVFNTRVFAGEERVEMRWQNWPSQNRENLWDGDVNFEPSTTRTAIMQIKSNTGGEPIYIQVTTDGEIRNNGDRTPLARNMANKWFNLKASFNPASGLSRAWINDVLVKTRQYNTSSRDWYFKNGTYNNGIPAGGRSAAHFRNVRFWRR